MSAAITITRAGPLATIQDGGRPGLLRHGIGASGPMDRMSFAAAGDLLGTAATSGVEFTQAGLCFTVQGKVSAAVAGGAFTLKRNGIGHPWNEALALRDGDVVDIAPGPGGNYGYLRFDAEIDVPLVLGSRATNSVVGLGGLDGRTLRAGDRLPLLPAQGQAQPAEIASTATSEGPIRVIWGIHSELFPLATREKFLAEPFTVSRQLDRMGVRLKDNAAVFAEAKILSLVSDAIVAGDIQILGDGTPIVLMRDHQPTGGYPRIATLVTADLDRFAQVRPGSQVRFQSVTPQHARAL